VSLIKVQDARRALRRRYASRTNIEKIFSQYDKDEKGQVTAKDLYMQAKQLGLGLTQDEA